MVTAIDIQERLEQLHLQIITQLQEHTRLCQEAGGLDGDQESELLSLWIEEASERGMDEVKMERIAKLLMGMCRIVDE